MLNRFWHVSFKPGRLASGQEERQPQAETQPKTESGHYGGERITRYHLDDRTSLAFETRRRFKLPILIGHGTAVLETPRALVRGSRRPTGSKITLLSH